MADFCEWSDVYSEQGRFLLQLGLYSCGILAVLGGIWVNTALLLTELREDPTYRNLSLFTIAGLMRRVIPVFSFRPIAVLVEYWLEPWTSSCNFFAFLDTFLAIFEVEAITHVCIERYVKAKYINRGWTVPNSHYVLFSSLCVFFSFLYSIPPLFGVGSYSEDFSCKSCTFYVDSPGSLQKFLAVSILLLRSVKPPIMMHMMLRGAKRFENAVDNTPQNHAQKRFTRIAQNLAFITFLFWFPNEAIRIWVALVAPSLASVKSIVVEITVASWLHWMTPAVAATVLFLSDDRIRRNMMNVWSSENEDQAKSTSEGDKKD